MNSITKPSGKVTLRPFRLLTTALGISVMLLCLFVLMMRHFGPLIAASYLYSERSVSVDDH